MVSDWSELNLGVLVVIVDQNTTKAHRDESVYFTGEREIKTMIDLIKVSVS